MQPETTCRPGFVSAVLFGRSRDSSRRRLNLRAQYRGATVAAGVWIMFAAFLLPSLHAATRFWDGSANGNLSTAANWVGGVAPLAGDDLVFQTSVTRLLVTNDFSPNRAWNRILFQGSNYFVRGSDLIVTNGISSANSAGANTIDANVVLRASQTWEAQGALASLDVNGDINLNASTLTVRANTGDFFFSGVISGTGNLVKTNVGTLRMDGAGHNTYSGFTRFDGGVLELRKFAIFPALTNFTAIPGSLAVGDGNGLSGTDVLRLLADDQIADTSAVTVKNSGLFDLNDFSERIGDLTLQGSTVETGDGILTLNGDVATLSDTNTAFINGQLSLGGKSRVFNISSGPPAADLRINATISSGNSGLLAATGITKAGGGSLYLAGTNTYNGLTTIDDGQLAILTDRALGATAAPLGGNPATIINGDGNLFLSDVQVTNEDLTISSSNPGGAFNASGSSIWTGDISLSANTFISSSGSLRLIGRIAGASGFTKISTGSLTLEGTNANTYTGTTIVRDGTLLLNKDPATASAGSMAGPLIIGEDELPENADVVRFLACCQIPNSADVTINASGLLDLNGFGQNVRNLIFNGGDVAAPSPGSILPTDNITVNANTNSQAIISGRLSVVSSPIVNTIGHHFSPDLRITAVVFGAGALTKNGVGELGLTGANTYSGLTTVNDGFLLVDDSSALGSTAAGTIVRSGAVLALRFGVNVLAETLSIGGTGQSDFGALDSSFGSNSWSGNITLTSDTTISVDATDFLNLPGSVTGGFDLTKTDTGTLLFSGGTANSFDQMFLQGGVLVLDKTVANGAGPSELTIGDGTGTDTVRLLTDNQLADTCPVHISMGGRLDLNDQNETTGSIDGPGIVDLGSGILREGQDNGSSMLSGLIIGTGSVFKLGLGTWTLTGNNTYSGQTTVSAGTLVVNGAQHHSPVNVNGTGNLEGTGLIGDLQVFGTVRPGTSPGILTSSNVNFASQADYFVELNGSTPGTGYDQLKVRGTNQLGNSTLHLTIGSGFAPVEGERFTIIDNDGAEAIQGTFNGLPNGSLINASGLQFRIYYSDVFINDVFLMVTNTALELATNVIVETGNGNGEIEPGECNTLRIPLLNKLAGIVSGVSATLTTTQAGVTVTQPTSTYPNLPANAIRTNSMPFQISTVPSLLCGTNIDLLLVVNTSTNGSFSVPITVFTGSGGSALRFNRTGDQAIPDLGTLDSTLNVSGVTTPIHHVVVSLHLSHTVDDNLDLSLEAPDGTTVLLSSDNGGTLDDYGTSCTDADRTTFSDTAFTAITATAPPFRGTFKPEQPLSALRGKFGSAINGTWHLRIVDDAGGGVGTLHCWSLQVFPTVCVSGGGVCDPPCPGCVPSLSISPDPATNAQVVIKWSTSAVGYNLVATNFIQSPFNPIVPVLPAPVVVNSKFTVTNSVAGSNRFYRLRKP